MVGIDRPPAAAPRKRSSFLIVGISIGILITCGGLGGIGYLAYREMPSGESLPAAAADYRKAGLPWTADQLAPNPPVVPVENAAPLIREMSRELSGFHAPAGINAAEAAINRNDFVGAQKLIAPYESSIETAVAASRRPRVDWKRDYDLFPMVMMPEYQPLKFVCQLLRIRAQIDAARGQTEPMLEDLRAIGRLGQLAGQEPTMITLLAQLSILGIEENAVQRCGGELAADPLALQKLSALADEPTKPPDLESHFRGEVYMGVATARNLPLYPDLLSSDPQDPRVAPVDARKVLRSGFPSKTIDRMLMASLLRYATKADLLLRRPNKGPIAVGKQLDELLDQFQGVDSVLVVMLAPYFSQLAITMLQRRTDQELTRALLRALLMHARTGRFPTSIGEIPGTWTDPFTGKSLKLKLSAGAIRIYSVGPTGVDHGGRTKAEIPGLAAASQDFDIVAAYPPLPYEVWKPAAAPSQTVLGLSHP